MNDNILSTFYQAIWYKIEFGLLSISLKYHNIKFVFFLLDKKNMSIFKPINSYDMFYFLTNQDKDNKKLIKFYLMKIIGYYCQEYTDVIKQMITDYW